MIPGHWQAVARSDGETVGYVEPTVTGFVARDLLGWDLGGAQTHDEAATLVVDHGLASLGRSWEWTDGSGTSRRVHLVHVRPGLATVSTGHPNVVGAPGERFEVALPVDPATFRPA
jgi:hypothetical protein